MDYRIVADSSCEATKDLMEEINLGIVALNIDIDDKHFIDREDLDRQEFLKAMRNSKDPVRTSSPSPNDFISEYEKADNIFVVTITSALSSTYSNAVLAKDMVLETTDKFIHVFDSLSASVGETLIALKIKELIDKNMSCEEIVKNVESYIESMKTMFILEKFDNLVKNGRVNKVMATVASALSIKPIMEATSEGTIALKEKVRGQKRAFKRLVESIGEDGDDFEDKILGISHCNAEDLANDLKLEIEEKYNFKEVLVFETSGLTSAYADEGGVIISY